MVPLVVPSASGVSALEDLAKVPWRTLGNAYSGAEPGTYAKYLVPLDDAAAILRAFAEPDEDSQDEAFHGVMGTLHHQGDLYEATAYAVPFLCALAADPPFRSEPRLLCGLITIAECTTYEKNAAVAPAVLKAFEASAGHIERIAARPGRPTVRRLLVDLAHGRPWSAVDEHELDDLDG